MEKSHVSMEHKICHVCGKEYSTDAILLDKRLRSSMERTTITGLGTCYECATTLASDTVALVEVSNPPAPNGHLAQKDAIRTGNIAFITRSILEDLTTTAIPTDMVFVEVGTILRIESLLKGTHSDEN